MPTASSLDLEDIEDLVAENANSLERNSLKKAVLPHPRITAFKNKSTSIETVANQKSSSIIPGTQTIYLKTWGCTHNTSDSEYMAGQLAAYGYNITDNSNAADLWLLNSCTVKNPAEDHFRNMVEKGQKQGKHVVVAGCVSQGAPRQEYIKGLSLIGVQQIDRVVEVVEETLKGNSVRLLGQKKIKAKKLGGASLDLPKIRRNPLIEIISINTGSERAVTFSERSFALRLAKAVFQRRSWNAFNISEPPTKLLLALDFLQSLCLNACTYCKTKHARGELGSYPIKEIVERARQSFEEGVVEIWLTSEDTGAYGRDIDTSLPELLWQLVDIIPEECMMRIGMTNPPYIMEHLEEMAKVLNHPRVYAFLHVPVQSGSDQTLYEMRREYTVEDFSHVVDFLRSRVPGISIATDIICGFPTETEEDFEQTLQLCEKYKFPSLFMNQFFPRPGTPAARMPQIDRKEIKRRTKRLSELFQSYVPYTHQLGKTQTVLVTEIAHDGKHYVGHNKFYEQVLIEMDENLMGKAFDVKIYETGKHYLRGKRIGSIRNPNRVVSLARGEVSGFVPKVSRPIVDETKIIDYAPKTSSLSFVTVIIVICVSYLIGKIFLL